MSRTLTRNVVIEASPDVVWRALTEPKELVRWFPLEAKLEPRLGGSIWLSWGEGTEGAAPITAWEPEQRLQWTEGRPPHHVTVDFNLEARAGCTVVRVVQAGFGVGPDGDDEMMIESGAWSYFLQHLKWYLEHHVGTARRMVSWREAVRLAPHEAFERLLGAAGLSTANTIIDRVAGDSYETTTAAGETLSGQVLARSVDACQIGLTVAELGDAILFVEVAVDESESQVGFWLSTYGLEKKTVSAIRQRFGELYRSALGLEDEEGRPPANFDLRSAKGPG